MPHRAAVAGGKGIGPAPALSHGMITVLRDMFHVGGHGGMRTSDEAAQTASKRAACAAKTSAIAFGVLR